MLELIADFLSLFATTSLHIWEYADDANSN